jgi:purine-nucleoside/S-methyl-5'-thioadenosine phosphorylase / adenosine deaminase
MALPDRSSDLLPAPGDDFEWRPSPAGTMLVCRALEPYAPHLFTTREWQLGTAGVDTRDAAWRQVADAMHVDAAHLARLHQVHGAGVVVRRREESNTWPSFPDADVLVSNDPTTAVAIQTADCVPLLMADCRTGAVAAAHAGWRGLAAGVPGVAVRALRDAFGTHAEDVIVAIGPAISADHYEVDDAVRSKFEAAGWTEERLAGWFLPGRRDDHWQFDGSRSAVDQLEDAGVPREQIHVAALCTTSHAQLCSYRRDGKSAGRIAAVIRARQ